ncbi:MAG TPA: Gfo/Idh/MocA family oxidoreductase [Methylomirabilota bacterium]|nr:Gfo/Idh/MocA family oxidoreductase [Methylomirabilota bacterium]
MEVVYQESRSASEGKNLSQILRLGIAGLGVASTQILPPLSALPYVKIAAAADTRADALAKFRQLYGGATFTSVEAMCASATVDVIYVATPNPLHARHVIAAAERGKHVIVEKPMALSMAECDRMNEAAEKHGVKLLCGHTHSFDLPIRKIREIVKGGELGKLRMIHSWNFNEFMYRPRMKHELAMSRGVVLNQGPHQVDIVRLIGGGLVRSVRAMTGVWDQARGHEGSYTCYLEFVDGTPATLVYSGYGFFDTAELFGWVGEGGQCRDPKTNLNVRRRLREIRSAEEEEQLKEAMRFGGMREGEYSHFWQGERKQPFFGFTLVSCEKGDIRQTPDGLCIYGEFERREIKLPAASRGREAEVEELYNAVAHDRPVFHDGRWGAATLEVCLAILESAEKRREIFLSRQVPSPE